jgi:hypothetical protein
VLPCSVDERVCDQKPRGAQDESFLMYMRVLEEFGVTVPFTEFEIGVLKFLNVAPSHIRPSSWAFIRGLEILCKALDLEPSVGAFLHFYGTKDVNKGTWITISTHHGKNLFLLMLRTSRRNSGILLLGYRELLDALLHHSWLMVSQNFLFAGLEILSE